MKEIWDKVKAALQEKSIDAILISSEENIFYTSHFPINVGARNRIFYHLRMANPVFVIISPEEEPKLIVKESIIAVAKRFSWIKSPDSYKTRMDIPEHIMKLLKETGVSEGTIGIEELLPAYMVDQMRKRLPNAKFIYADDVLKDARKIKTKDEIKKLKRALAITEKSLEAAIYTIEEGVTEIEILREFQKCCLAEGASWAHTKVSAGDNSAVMSHQPSGYTVKKNDLVLFDVGATFDGYIADIARVAVVGKPSVRQRNLYNTLLKTHEKLIEMMKPGASVAEIFKTGLKSIRNAGYSDYTRTHFGHGVGIGLQEKPMITSTETDKLKPCMVLCVEVPFYKPDYGGLNIEVPVLVTKEGHEDFSTLNKELFIRT